LLNRKSYFPSPRTGRGPVVSVLDLDNTANKTRPVPPILGQCRYLL